MKDKVLKLCRRLKKCTLNDLIAFTEGQKDIIETALLYLEQENAIEIKNELIFYIKDSKKETRVDRKNINLMFEYRTPEEIEIIIKGFCLEIPTEKIQYIANIEKGCAGNYYAIFRKLIYERQFKSLLQNFFDKPQVGRYRMFYEKFAYFYVYKKQVFISDRLLRASLEYNYSKSEIREFKIMYNYLARIESHNKNEAFMYHRLAEYIWRRNRDFEVLYSDLKNNLLNIYS